MMVVFRLIILAFVLVLCYASPGQEPSLISIPPESYNASLGTVVEFRCVGVDGVIAVGWRVTGANPGTHSDSNTGNSGTLRIEAIEENDGAEVVCELFMFGGLSDESEPAVLRVQGLLTLPVNLMVTNMDVDAITLTWDRPPTIDLTDIHPDISNYTVYIELNSSHVWSENVTETEYTFTGLPGETEVNPCHVYQFSVSAWNVVGEGEQSDPVEGYVSSVPPALQSASVIDVNLTQHNTPNILATLKFQADKVSLCLETIATTVICNEHQPCTPRFQYTPSHVMNTTVTGIVSDGDCIPNNHFCEVKFSIQNKDGSSLSTQDARFSTFDVQEVEVMAYSDRVMVTCYFATGSPAKGCYLLFTSSVQDMQCFLRVYWNDKSFLSVSAAVKGLPVDTYSISVYDTEEDNTISSVPSYQHRTTVMFNTTSSGDSELQCVSTILTEDEDEGDGMLALYITIPVIVLVVVIILVLLLVLGLLYKWAGKKGAQAPIAMKENSAYVTVVPQRGGATHQMEPCPAYGIARRQC